MKYPTLKEICADAGDKKTWEEFATQGLKNDQHFWTDRPKVGAVLAERHGVEHTFAWLNHFRRLSKDYEFNIKSTEPFIMIAYSMPLLKFLC